MDYGSSGVWDSPMATDYWVRRFGFMWGGGQSGLHGIQAFKVGPGNISSWKQKPLWTMESTECKRTMDFTFNKDGSQIQPCGEHCRPSNPSNLLKYYSPPPTPPPPADSAGASTTPAECTAWRPWTRRPLSTNTRENPVRHPPASLESGQDITRRWVWICQALCCRYTTRVRYYRYRGPKKS